MRRHGVRWSRRLIYLATVLALVLSLVPLPAFPPPVARAADTPRPPDTAARRGTPPVAPDLPSLSLAVAVAPDPVALGTVATLTVTIENEARTPASDLVVTLPPPAGATPQPGPGYVSAADGWRWSVGTLAAHGQATVSGTLLVASAPPGDALLLTVAATAHGLPAPVLATGGALVDPLAVAVPAPSASPTAPPDPRATASRATGATRTAAAPTPTPLATPTPSGVTRTVPFIPGRPTSLTSADGRVRVAIPGDASDQPLTLGHSTRPQHGEAVPPVPAGRTGDLGVFYLGASDGGGRAVHQFRAPVTVRVGYTPEQLRVRGIAADDLGLFWFDEGARRWVAIPARVDTAAGEVVAQVAHFSAFSLGDGSAPSTNYLPSSQGWQTDLSTGAADYSLPIEVPAGPGGLKPDLALRYNSQATDGPTGVRPEGRAGWAGLGWSFEIGSVALQRTYADDNVFYSLTFNGKAYTLTRGDALVANPSKGNPADWEWRTSDESFIRVRAVANGATDGTGADPRSIQVNGQPVTRYTWRVRTTENTVYEFAEDLWQGFDNCQAAGEARFETYQWMLTKVTDAYGNQLTYSYDVQSYTPTQPITCSGSTSSGGGTVQIDARPRRITWGANVNTGAPDRYKVRLDHSDRTDDLGKNPANGQYGGRDAAPRPVGVLDAIWVYSNPSSPYADTADAWQVVRGYTLTHDYSLHCDNTVNGDNDPTCPRLTLKGVRRWGSDAGPGVAGTYLPDITFSYGTARGSNYDPRWGGLDWPNANWNRLVSVDNGQGGSATFAYEQIGLNVTGPVKGTIFANRRRVQSQVQGDGQGNSYTWRYQYANPELNSLGWQLGGYNGDGTTNETQQYPNSAALYLGWRWASNSYAWLVVPPSKEFRGHNQVRVIDPTGNYVDHWFYQGDVGCAPNATGTTLATYDNDPCFTQLRDREFLKGREYKTEQYRGADNALLRRTEHAYAIDFAGYTTSPDVGVWRAWTREIRTIERAYEGGATPATKTTNYAYDAANYQQGQQQYGNVTRIAEYDGDWQADNTVPRVRLTERWYDTLDDNGNLRTTAVQQEAIRGATDGDLLALTNNFYDGILGGPGVGPKGELQLVRRHANPATKDRGSDTAYAYDPYGNRTGTTTYAGYATAPLGAAGGGSAARTTTTTYDPLFHAFATASTPPDPNGVNLTETAGYDYRLGTLTGVTDANGATTTAQYDVFGRMAVLIRPGDTAACPTAQFYYYDNDYALYGTPTRYIVGRQEVAATSQWQPSTVFYDGLGRPIQAKRESVDGAQNIVTDTHYDGLGRADARSQPRYVNETSATFWTRTPFADPATERWTTASFDALGRPTAVTNPRDDSSTTYTNYGTTTYTNYDTDGHTINTNTTDPNGHFASHGTDLFGRLRYAWEFQGDGFAEGPFALYAQTAYAYDGRDLLTGVTDARGNATTMAYDGLGRKLGMHDPDMGDWAYAYNPDGTIASQTDAKGQATTFGYDALGRLTSRATPADGRTAGYGYDATAGGNAGKGRQTSRQLAAGGAVQTSATLVYDQRGRVTSQGTWTAALNATRTVQTAYDSADRVASLTYPGGEVVTLGYDAGWRQTSLCSATYSLCYASGATYSALDAPTGWAYGNGLAQAETYDTLGHLTGLTVGGGVLSRSYTYDAVGNVKTIGDPVLGQTQNFQYDHRDRLTHAWTTGSATAAYDESYAYDQLGDLTAKGPTAAPTPYSYPASGAGSVRPHAVTAVGAASYGYDANGNLTSRAGKALTWNADNTLASMVGPDGVQEGYTYDSEGQRVARQRLVPTPSGVTTVYVGGVWEEDAPGGATRSLYRLNGQVIAQRAVAGGTATVTYLHGDQLGSVSASSTSAGALQGQQRYTPFGEIRQGAGTLPTTVGFTAQYRDDTGLLYYGARYYDPALGRFLSADSIVPGVKGTALTVDFHESALQGAPKRAAASRSAQALNRYAYAYNNPPKYTDPSGHCDASGGPDLEPGDCLGGGASGGGSEPPSAAAEAETAEAAAEAGAAEESAAADSGAEYAESDAAAESAATDAAARADYDKVRPKEYYYRQFYGVRENGVFRQFSGQFELHHRIPLDVLLKRPNLYSGDELSEASNLEVIPNASGVHTLLTNEWKAFLKANPEATRAEIEAFAQYLDEQYSVRDLPSRYFFNSGGGGSSDK